MKYQFWQTEHARYTNVISKAPRTMMLRDKAGKFEVNGGTGAITRMCVVDDCLEIYKIDKTFRAVSPDGLDPEKTNPEMPWVISEHSNIGSAHPVVARILLQSAEILKSTIFERELNQDRILSILHDSKEQILKCEMILTDLVKEMTEIEEPIKESGIEIGDSGRSINPFPKLSNLDDLCSRYLYSSKRTIQNLARLVDLFYGTNIQLPRFDKIKNWARTNLGEESYLFQMASENESKIVHIVDLRNYLEHPNQSKETKIVNYKLLPDMSINCPQWYVSGNQPEFILDDMSRINQFLFLFSESLFLHIVLENASKKFPYIIYMEEENKIDPECPIAFRISLDTSKLKFNESE